MLFSWRFQGYLGASSSSEAIPITQGQLAIGTWQVRLPADIYKYNVSEDFKDTLGQAVAVKPYPSHRDSWQLEHGR
jgi:hypothetical protein